MALGPDQIGKAEMTPEQEKILVDCEAAIDIRIGDLEPETTSFTYSHPWSPSSRVRSELIRLYEEAGWGKVAWTHDQRDGGYFTFHRIEVSN